MVAPATPFEPTGSILALRTALRMELVHLVASPGEGLHARFESADRSPVDAENVLLYNVGTGLFAGVDRVALTIERSFALGDPVPSELSGARFRSLYKVRPADSGFRHWIAGARLAEFGPVDLGGDVRSPSMVWIQARWSLRVADSDRAAVVAASRQW